MKTPLFRLQYELDDAKRYTEHGSDAGAKIYLDDIEDVDLRTNLKAIEGLSYKETLKWLSTQGDNDSLAVTPFTTRTPEAVKYRIGKRNPRLLFISRPLHTIEMLDEFLCATNNVLPQGAYLWCHSMTTKLKRELIKSSYPWGLRGLSIAYNFIWHRVCPKLRLTRDLYFSLTQGKDRSMSRVEILGRLYRAGFEVLDERFKGGEFFVVAKKIKEPVGDIPPTGSPIIHLRRIGLNGEEIVVHKFRTMYTYSEYMQPYVYLYQNLAKGGKFKNDYRVNKTGHLLRSLWLDELPMMWNLIRGDIKLVGVRPLSKHYFSLYTPEMQQLRIRTKPGLLPPFYYEAKTPETIEEIQESERRYLEAYLKKPFATDWKYFWGIIGNILFRRKHSA